MATEVTDARAEKDAPPADQILFQMLTGAWVTQSIATAARFGIPDALASGPKTVDELAAKVGANAGATKRLMRMLTGIGVFASAEGGRYALTPLSERLREDTPGSLKHMFIAETDGVHWRSWEKVADAVRTGLPRPLAVFGMPAFDYYSKFKDEGEQFGRAMANVSGFASQAVLDAYDFSRFQTVLDVGGGNGSMVLSILKRYPKAKGIVADLPYIEAQAKASIQEAGMADRCRFQAADFFQGVPEGADAHVLKFILHDWNDEESVQLLKSCRSAIAPDGRILVLEVVVPESSGPDLSHLMDMNMMVMTGGMERTAKEYESLLARGGFQLTRIVPTASPFSVIEGDTGLERTLTMKTMLLLTALLVRFGGTVRGRRTGRDSRGRRSRAGVFADQRRGQADQARRLPRQVGRPLLLSEGLHQRLHARGAQLPGGPREVPGRQRRDRGRLGRHRRVPQELLREGRPELPPALRSRRQGLDGLRVGHGVRGQEALGAQHVPDRSAGEDREGSSRE